MEPGLIRSGAIHSPRGSPLISSGARLGEIDFKRNDEQLCGVRHSERSSSTENQNTLYGSHRDSVKKTVRPSSETYFGFRYGE